MDYLTADEACEALGVKKSTLYAYVSRGRLTSYRKGIRRERLYSRAELEALAGTTPSPAPASGRRRGRLPKAEEWMAYV
jgi:excisionase family DNA binding protein